MKKIILPAAVMLFGTLGAAAIENPGIPEFEEAPAERRQDDLPDHKGRLPLPSPEEREGVYEAPQAPAGGASQGPWGGGEGKDDFRDLGGPQASMRSAKRVQIAMAAIAAEQGLDIPEASGLELRGEDDGWYSDTPEHGEDNGVPVIGFEEPSDVSENKNLGIGLTEDKYSRGGDGVSEEK